MQSSVLAGVGEPAMPRVEDDWDPGRRQSQLLIQYALFRATLPSTMGGGLGVLDSCITSISRPGLDRR